MLQEAVGNRRVSIDTLQVLVDAGADPTVGPRCLTFAAARTGELARVEFCRRLGCPVDGMDHDRTTLIHEILQADRGDEIVSLCEYAIRSGVAPSTKSKEYGFPLLMSIYRGLPEVSKLLLRNGGADDIPGWTSAFSAVVDRDLPSIRSSRSRRASFLHCAGGYSLFQTALATGDLEIVTTLIDSIPDSGEPSVTLEDALQWGTCRYSREILEWIVADVCVGKLGPKARGQLHSTAAGKGDLEFVRWLGNNQILPDAVLWESDFLGATSIQMIEYYRSVGVLDFENGSRPEHEIILEAVQAGRADILMYLIGAGGRCHFRRLQRHSPP